MQEPSSVEQGRVGIHIEMTTLAVAPGDRVTIPIVLSNHGLDRDILTLAVDGIPTNWVYASSASTPLSPGQKEEVSLTIQPPHTLQAGAGRHAFQIRATSQLAPSQVFEVPCVLTIAAFGEFNSELRPQRVESGEPARVTVENRGNSQQAFTLTCQSLDNELFFEPGPSQQVHVPPGQVGLAEFRASPRNRPFLGGEVTFPYTARVQSGDGAVQNHNGEVVSRALIPNWVIPAVLVLMLVAACAAAALLIWLGSPEEAPAPPPATTMPGEGQPTSTELPPELPTEALPTEAPPVAPTEAIPTEVPPEVPTEAPPPEPTPEQPVEATPSA